MFTSPKSRWDGDSWESDFIVWVFPGEKEGGKQISRGRSLAWVWTPQPGELWSMSHITERVPLQQNQHFFNSMSVSHWLPAVLGAFVTSWAWWLLFSHRQLSWKGDPCDLSASNTTRAGVWVHWPSEGNLGRYLQRHYPSIEYLWSPWVTTGPVPIAVHILNVWCMTGNKTDGQWLFAEWMNEVKWENWPELLNRRAPPKPRVGWKT